MQTQTQIEDSNGSLQSHVEWQHMYAKVYNWNTERATKVCQKKEKIYVYHWTAKKRLRPYPIVVEA